MKEMKKLPIDLLHEEDLCNAKHPSLFEKVDQYNIFIVRLPVITHEVLNVSFGFVVFEDKSYFFNAQTQLFEELDGKYAGIHSILDKQTDRLLKAYIRYQELVFEMEENLYANNTGSDFLHRWLNVKLDILKVEKVLLRTTDTVEDFIRFYRKDETFPLNHFTDLHEHLDRTMRSATLQLSKLDELYNFYNAKSNDKMNKMIYLLTILSAIFLPLNLVVGFFGMNTTGLPFSSGESGTYYAISFMLVLAFVTFLIMFFWRKKVEK
jgi:magnesium transporter